MFKRKPWHVTVLNFLAFPKTLNKSFFRPIRDPDGFLICSEMKGNNELTIPLTGILNPPAYSFPTNYTIITIARMRTRIEIIDQLRREKSLFMSE